MACSFCNSKFTQCITRCTFAFLYYIKKKYVVLVNIHFRRLTDDGLLLLNITFFCQKLYYLLKASNKWFLLINSLSFIHEICARIKNLLLQKQYLFNDIVAKLKIIKAFFYKYIYRLHYVQNTRY